MSLKTREWIEKQRERLAPEDMNDKTWEDLPEHERKKLIENEKSQMRNFEVEER